jgi:hypothetical protein
MNTATGAPRGARRLRQRRRSQRFALFGAPPPRSEGWMKQSPDAEMRRAVRRPHALQRASPRRKPGSRLPSRLRSELDSGLRRNDECRRVGNGIPLPTAKTLVGTLRFAHPTVSNASSALTLNLRRNARLRFCVSGREGNCGSRGEHLGGRWPKHSRRRIRA